MMNINDFRWLIPWRSGADDRGPSIRAIAQSLEVCHSIVHPPIKTRIPPNPIP